MKKATHKPWGVNVPLLYPNINELMDIIVEEGVKIVFTSAGNPAKWTGFLKEKGIKVVHVIANGRFAKKCEDAGVDAIVAEGFEAGGHNGREETTTLALIPAISQQTSLPLIAAGGIGTGRGMMAAMTLGADGVQIGSRFAITEESSAHENFKNRVVETPEGGTLLALKKLAPVRLIKNAFFEQVHEAEKEGASTLDLQKLLGKGRAKKGIFEGDMDEGELEIGQIASLINTIKPVSEVFDELIEEYRIVKEELSSQSRFNF